MPESENYIVHKKSKKGNGRENTSKGANSETRERLAFEGKGEHEGKVHTE